ncbi:MAG TPA: hypothetical protein VID03_11435 [Acidimicrobiia bacterium]|jgi:hypothetical protein
MRRSLAAIALAFAFVLGTLPAWADDLDAAVNSFRGDALPVDGWLDAFAQRAADRQAAAGQPSHSNLEPLLERCSAAGEVVGLGPDLGVIFDLFGKSSTHRSVIRADKWTHMGGGQARTSTGLFVAVVFCTMKDSDPPPATTTTTGPPATTSTPATTSAPSPPEPAAKPQQVVAEQFTEHDWVISVIVGIAPGVPLEDWRFYGGPTVV